MLQRGLARVAAVIIACAICAVVFQLAGVLYAAYGQKAFLGMFVVSAIGMAALVTLVRVWKGELLVGAQPA